MANSLSSNVTLIEGDKQGGVVISAGEERAGYISPRVIVNELVDFMLASQQFHPDVIQYMIDESDTVQAGFDNGQVTPAMWQRFAMLLEMAVVRGDSNLIDIARAYGRQFIGRKTTDMLIGRITPSLSKM